MNENRIEEIAEVLYHPEHIADDIYDITGEESNLDNLVEVVSEQIKQLVRERASGSDEPVCIDPAKVAYCVTVCGAVLDDALVSEIVEYINDLVAELAEDQDFDDMLKG